jgi:hypothetical protein
MKSFKIVSPKNEILYNLMIEKIIQLFQPLETYGDFYCFKSKSSVIVSNVYADFQAWEEKEISIFAFLDIIQIGVNFEKKDFPSWINNLFIMAYNKSKKQWEKIIFSHIGESAFYATSGVSYTEIAELNDYYLGKDLIDTDSIHFDNVLDFDISNILGIGMFADT